MTWTPVVLYCIYHRATNTPIAVWDEAASQWQDAKTGEHMQAYDHIDPHEVTNDGK